MLVRAVKRGFFGGLYRRPGDRFECSSEAFSSNWMEEVTEDMQPIKKEAYQPLEAPSLQETGNIRKAAKKVKKQAKSKTNQPKENKNSDGE